MPQKLKTISSKRVAKLLGVLVAVIIFVLIGVNLVYLTLYSRNDTLTQQNYSDRLFLTDPEKICVHAPLNLPSYIIPNLGVRIVIDEDTIPLWRTQIALDNREYSYDPFSYRGDMVCVNHTLDVGSHNLAIIRTAYPTNLLTIISFYVQEDGTVTANK